MNIVQKTQERFWSKVSKSDCCWEWLAYKDKDGFGTFFFNGTPQKSHRVAWKLTNGTIPKEVHVLHKCHSNSCVNPDHLFIGTQHEQDIQKRFWEKVRIVDEDSECWIWQAGKSKLGYGIFKIRGKDTPAHRVAWELKCGAIPNSLHCLHRCDVRACVRPSHLFLGTHAENMADMAQKGRAVTMRGESHKLSKLTEENVIRIRQIYEEGRASQRQIARDFSVSQCVIKQVILRRTWKHI